MNKRLFVIMILLTIFFIWNIKADTSLSGKTIVLDAGHGGIGVIQKLMVLL